MRWTNQSSRPLRHHAPEPPAGRHPHAPTEHTPPGRLNLLLSDAGWNDESWADQLPRLLQPMGVSAVRVTSGTQAAKLLNDIPVHIAMVDLHLPLNAQPTNDTPHDSKVAEPEGGERLLQLLARLEAPPPTVIVHRRKTRRETSRQVASALRAGAFAAIERPVHLETVLEVMRRILRRYYANRWPDS